MSQSITMQNINGYPRPAEEISRLVEAAAPMLDDLQQMIFEEYGGHLIENDPAFIVPAVWGRKREGALTAVQKEMYNRLNPLVKSIMHQLDFSGLEPEHHFDLEYLLRGLIIYNLGFFTQALRCLREAGDGAHLPPGYNLAEMKTQGRS